MIYFSMGLEDVIYLPLTIDLYSSERLEDFDELGKVGMDELSFEIKAKETKKTTLLNLDQLVITLALGEKREST